MYIYFNYFNFILIINDNFFLFIYTEKKNFNSFN